MKISPVFASWALDPGHLADRMSFIAGPRQIGKTTLIENFLAQAGFSKNYFNWDITETRRLFAKNPTFFTQNMELQPNPIAKPWVAFDEIHKYPKWKNILKGYYDSFRRQLQFVITGSARLDLFRRSGDSLVGRYFLFKMFPIGLHDVLGGGSDSSGWWRPDLPLTEFPSVDHEVFDLASHLMAYGGFPQPFLKGEETFSTRWRDNHISLVVTEDLKDLSKIGELRKVETLAFLLPERVGSPLSLNALKGPLECAHNTIKIWLEALTKVYVIFGLSPWTWQLSRAVLKEQKYYFWDWGMVEDVGDRFENFVAVQLSRAVSAWNELGYGPFGLNYARTKDGWECDFVISKKNRVLLLVECKQAEEVPALTLVKLKERLKAPLTIQLINQEGVLKFSSGIHVVGIDRFLNLLP